MEDGFSDFLLGLTICAIFAVSTPNWTVVLERDFERAKRLCGERGLEYIRPSGMSFHSDKVVCKDGAVYTPDEIKE